MTPFPHAIEPEASLDAARRMMSEHRIRHLPVKRGNLLVGLITDRDIKLVLGPYLSGDQPDRPRVRHACIGDAYSVETAAPLHQVVREMARRRIGSALVTKDGRLAGIFTATDACAFLADLLDPEGAGDGPTDGEAA